MNLSTLTANVLANAGVRGISGFCVGYLLSSYLARSNPLLVGAVLATHNIALETYRESAAYLRSQPGNGHQRGEAFDAALSMVLTGSTALLVLHKIDLIDTYARNVGIIFYVASAIIMIGIYEYRGQQAGPVNRGAQVIAPVQQNQQNPYVAANP